MAASVPRSAAGALRAGHRALDEGDPQQALECAEALLGVRPKSIRAAGLKALALHGLDRSEEALEVLEAGAALDPSHHLPPLLQAVVRHDLGRWEAAARAIAALKPLTDEADFAAAGLERLILARTGERAPDWKAFGSCPSMYNRFVAPRVLLYVEEQVLARRETLDLKRCRWARPAEDAIGPPQARSWRTDLGFAALRLPVLVVYRLLGRAVMPFRAEEAYLRGDLAAARAAVTADRAYKHSERLRECAAFLSMDLEDWQACRKLLPPPAEPPDPVIEHARGRCSLHLGKWAAAEEAFARATSQPLGWYYLGLCRAAGGNPLSAIRAFEREFSRNDLGLAERIHAACLALRDAPAAATSG
ncbi:MAG TPA: hypothetical protein PKX48_06035 [Planctomycetota bacterium]|jgi:tetratricopeptide (TPR) repeat protein|nr:hypothetical protein [Planctomycetota bacterium]OQC19952.1 MAG: Tetratricopeptide repeat protein [Planctomycetes bacterium ADurb.Bin069]HNR99497.1 hypothetical protein [Planctomycetota bacterium]HNU27372.1 hypothetical protein [Planctomycetota bacterium]HOE30501.1 hypothetical protein [Planctomycetota bacterium]